MKKTLILMALLGGMTAQAEVVSVFAEGYDANNIQSAYHNHIVGSMCWGANASNIMAWWQDQLVEQGYTLPQGVPTGYNLYSEYQAAFNTTGGNTDSALEWWLDGYYYGQTAREGHKGGYYSDLLLPMDHNNYSSEGTMIKQFFPATYGSLEAYSAQVKNGLESGYAFAMRVSTKSYNITVWGADYDTETGLLTHLYYTDPHDTLKIYRGELERITEETGDYFKLWAMGTLSTTTGLSCHIEDYLTEAAYTDTGSGAFAPTYNVKLDSGSEYSLSKAMTAGGRANADVTITNGTVKVEENGSTEGAVIFAQGTTEGERKLSVQRTGLVLSEVKVNAASGNTLEVTTGNDVTITTTIGNGTLVKIGAGALVNGGTLGNIELKEGTLKGSGKFGSVIIDGGTLVVGNSPGHQEYEGALTLNSGRMVFSVAGFDASKTLISTGWESGTYSTINMNGHDLVIGEDGQILIALSEDAVNSLTMGSDFTLELVSGMANTLTDDQLAALAAKTTFVLSDEEGAGIAGRANLAQPEFSYQMSNGVLMLTSGTGADSGNANVPEPATGTLSLLALAGLMARRRRK